MSWTYGEKERRLIHRVYKNSGIETRYSVLDDFSEHVDPILFKTGPDSKPVEPGTRERNDCFARESRTLSVRAARRAFDNCATIGASDITHVITTTCTGFFNPGPDYFLVQDLGLKSSTCRMALGFMGCYAALPALRMACDVCRADSSATVLVVSVELCSLHLHLKNGMDSLLANAIFSDGSAAALISSRQPGSRKGALLMDGFASTLIPSGEKEMTWRLGNKGFDITLSSYVPDIIGTNIRAFLDPILASAGLAIGDIDVWAIHPGGKAIVDKIEHELKVPPEKVAASRRILRKYGNMSSATILFVLKDIMDRLAAADTENRLCAMAFGPGLTVESALLTAAG